MKILKVIWNQVLMLQTCGRVCVNTHENKKKTKKKIFFVHIYTSKYDVRVMLSKTMLFQLLQKLVDNK
jgi:hypothetical protein